MITDKKLFETATDAENACAMYVQTLLLDHRPYVLFYSGGSGLGVLRRVLENLPEAQLSQITIAPVDERFDPIHSNVVALKQQYPESLKRFTDAGGICIDTSPILQDQFAMADWYDSELKKCITSVQKKQGKIVMMLGLAPDGHTAGILPHPYEEKLFYERFFDTSRFVVGFDATGKNEHIKRFSITYQVIEMADEVVVFSAGKEKYAVIEQIEQLTPPLHKIPGAIIAYSSQNIRLFTST